MANAPAKTDPPAEPQINVTVTPAPGSSDAETKRNKEYADKIAPKIKEDVRRKVNAVPADDKKGRRDAQHDAGEKAAEQISPNKVKKVEIKVDDHTTTHHPNEGGDKKSATP